MSCLTPFLYLELIVYCAALNVFWPVCQTTWQSHPVCSAANEIITGWPCGFARSVPILLPFEISINQKNIIIKSNYYVRIIINSVKIYNSRDWSEFRITLIWAMRHSAWHFSKL